MTVGELIGYLERFPATAVVDVLIEVGELGTKTGHQFQFPANDVAFSKMENAVIIMHEKWVGNWDETKECEE